jgi:AhpD family alkylhydroperoxidase
MMPARLDYNVVAPDGLRTVRAFDQYVRKSGLEPGLVELVKLRASLMNGCAYCVDLHAREALAKGETEMRFSSLARSGEA